MADNSVTLDFSKAQPITAPPAQSPAVTLDFSQAQHLDQPTQQTPQTPQPSPHADQTTWQLIKDKLSEVFNPWDERNLHPTEVSAGAISRGASFDPTTQTLYDPAAHSGVIRGAEKGATQTLSGMSQLAGKIADKTGIRSANSKGTGILGEAPATAAETQPEGFAEHIGYLGENLTEYVMGDEALQGLSLAEKLGLATKIAKLAESHPVAAKLISAGLRATRTGTVSAGQELSHGGDGGDIATAGISGAASSVTSEGLGALAKLAKPGTTEIAGETMKTVPAWKSAGTAIKLAGENAEPATRAVANVAKDTAQTVLDKFGKQAPDTISSFGDAAREVQAAAKPTFAKLDELSKGEFTAARNELANATKVARRATSVEDLKAAEKAATDASAKIDSIFAKSEGKISAQDLDNAKSAWKTSKVLEKLHSKIDQAYSVPQSAAQAGVERALQLTKLQSKLNSAFKAIPDLQSVLGAENTRSLYRLSELAADPAKAKSLSEVATALGEHLGIGGAGLAVGALAGHALPGGSLALGAHFLYAHPELGSVVAKALSAGTKPKLIVPSVISLIDSHRESEQ